MEQKLIIDQSLPLDKIEETLLYEIVEVLSGYYSLNLDHEVKLLRLVLGYTRC